MRAAVTVEAGGPIETKEVREPEARAGEAVVRVIAASVNRLDRAVFDGAGLGRMARFPLIQGIDAAGHVETGTEYHRPGTRVVAKPTIACGSCRDCERGNDADCRVPRILGLHRQGGYAELVAVPLSNLFEIPASMAAAAAAAAAHVYPVALRMLRTAGILSGDVVLVTGAAGPVGSAAVQLATAMGGRVIGLGSTEAKRVSARSAGASWTPDAVGPRLTKELMDITEGEGVDVVIDATGDPQTLGPALDALARGGRLVVAGTHAGTTLELDLTRLYTGRRRILGSASASAADFADAFSMIREHHLRPVIARVYPLEGVRDALDSVLDRSRIGKTVVEVAPEED